MIGKSPLSLERQTCCSSLGIHHSVTSEGDTVAGSVLSPLQQVDAALDALLLGWLTSDRVLQMSDYADLVSDIYTGSEEEEEEPVTPQS